MATLFTMNVSGVPIPPLALAKIWKVLGQTEREWWEKDDTQE
jgi:hypothetical protein